MSRFVGRVLGEIPSSEADVPVHRVVNSQGVLSAKEAFGSPGWMQKLLEEEGITIVNDRIKTWKTVFWNPQEEIGSD